MKNFKMILPLILALGLLTSCAGAAPTADPSVQETLVALSVQSTLDTIAAQTAVAENSQPAATLAPPDREAGCGAYTDLDTMKQAATHLFSAGDFATIENDLLGEEIGFGFWRSEGIMKTPAEATEFFSSYLTLEYPFTLTFDPADFPAEIDDYPWADRFGGETGTLAYTAGWGDGGYSEAFLKFTEDGCGGYVLSSMIYADAPFGWEGYGPPVQTLCSGYTDLNNFKNVVVDIINNRFYGNLLNDQLLDVEIGVGYYQSEGVLYSALDFINAIEQNFYPYGSGYSISGTVDSASFPAEQGTSWLTYGGPDSTAVIFTAGWGDDGLGEAFFYVKSDECGGPIIHGMLYAPFGF